ncbi:Mobile element protein [Leucobacter sp. 7(1)]|nr:Mobile element protein [Leucobacter sp. 7(1)]
MNRFQFVEDHKDAYGVKRLCEVIQIARSSLYAWLAAAPGRAARAAADAALAARIRVLQDPAQGGDRAYGAPRITADLNDGVAAAGRVNHKRVARVMREHQLAGIRLRRRVRTTIPDQSGRRFPDLIERDFSIGEPNRRYVGDITYLPIADGSNLYLATCIDLGSRKLAGWQVADHMRVGLVEDALRAAARDRGTLAGAIFHSDHGSVYASKAYAALCEQLNIVQSMGAVGTSADNSLAESFNATLKRELLEGQAAFPDQATAYRAVFRWANRDNTRRRHSAIGQITPNNYETAYAETTSATLAEAA